MKNLNEIIKENENKFDELIPPIRFPGDVGFEIYERDKQLKSHLHQSQLNIVEWVREQIKEMHKKVAEGPRYDDFEAAKTFWNETHSILQELDKIV